MKGKNVILSLILISCFILFGYYYKSMYVSNSIEAINMKAMNKKYVYPLGEIVGIKATTDGVLVIGYEEENIEYIGGIEKGDPLPVTGWDGMFQALHGSDLQFEIFFLRPGMVRFVPDQVAPAGELMAENVGDISDLPAFRLAKRFGLVEGEVINGDHLGCAFQRDAVPAEKAGDIEIALGGQDGDQDQGCFRKDATHFVPFVCEAFGDSIMDWETWDYQTFEAFLSYALRGM